MTTPTKSHTTLRQSYVKDPARDPLAAHFFADSKTMRGVVEGFDGTYAHQSYYVNSSEGYPVNANTGFKST